MKKQELRVKVGVGVLIHNDGKILLIKRLGSHGSGTWAPPGGHIDFGESVFDCAKREVMEGVGVKIKDLKVIGFTQDLFKKPKGHYITIWASSNWKSGKVKTSDREFSQAQWFLPSRLPSPLFLPLANFTKGKVWPVPDKKF